MTLLEYLKALMSGGCDIIVTSLSDENFGYDNLEDGKYYLANENMGLAKTTDDVIELRGEIPMSWMDLPVYDCGGIIPSKEFCMAHEYVRMMIYICVNTEKTPRKQHEPLHPGIHWYKFYGLENFRRAIK